MKLSKRFVELYILHLVDSLLAGSIAATLIILFVYIWYRVATAPSAKGQESGRPTGADKAAPRTCPLCGASLGADERVKTDVAYGGGTRSMRIFGCPNCYPPNPGRPRICPVCGKELPREGHVIARLFESPGRKHVHVLGCTACRVRS